VTVADPAQALRAELGALEKAFALGHHGRSVAHRRAELVDACLRGLFELAGAPPNVALAATGGYGRTMQLPLSDIDLVVVHGGDEVVGPTVDAILYPLWDAGFAVGHAVRTPEECSAAIERFDAWTAMLDGRWIVGDRDLVEQALGSVRAAARTDPSAFARRVQEAARVRRARFGSCAHLLEPELKEGGGGLRDVASLGWLVAAAGADLTAAGAVREREAALVDAAEDFLIRVRSAVQLLTGRRDARLVAELQPDVAREVGFVDEPDLPAPDALMRAIFEHARDVEHVSWLAVERIAGDATGGASPTDAASVLEALADAAERAEVPSPGLLDAIERADVPDPVVWDARARTAFLRVLRAGDAGAAMLDVLDRIGLLARFIPAWWAVRCRPQRDPYHRSTVDAHLVSTARGMAELLDGDADGIDPTGEAIVPQARRTDALLLGALLHDIGKVGKGGHVEAGTSIARGTLEAMGVPAGDAELAVFMVAEHLLLPDTATRRDLSDEELLVGVAARIGSTERLDALSLLAKADALATGPAAWTSWREALLRQLVVKVGRVFDRGQMGEELAAQLARRTERIRDLLRDEPDRDVDRFVLRMPRGYFLAVDPDRAAEHARLITSPVGAREVRTAAVEGPRPGTYEVVVIATDRPGLLSWIAGALTIEGVSILSAQAFTTDDGVALDVFEVEGAFEPEITERRWRAFRATLRRTIEGSISLDHRVDEKRRHYPRPRLSTPVTVREHNDVSEFSTVIEVGAPDRIGLLFDITRTFADLHLDVHLAKVATFEGRVVDAFYVRDSLGQKIVDPRRLDEIAGAVRDRLAERI
jgi:[protein-PII] uridylyltransferase